MVLEWMWRSPSSQSQTTFKYKEQKSFHKRKEEALRARRLHPQMVPVVLEKCFGFGEKAEDLSKTKFLVSGDKTVGEFYYLIRKKINFTPEEALFFFVNGNTLVPMSKTMESVYNEHHQEDFILYLAYGKESAFG